MRASALGYNPLMKNFKSFFEGTFSKIIGILIILSIADQVLTSMELTHTVERIFDIFYLLTITLFSLEFLIRVIVIRKFAYPSTSVYMENTEKNPEAYDVVQELSHEPQRIDPDSGGDD